MLLNQLRPHQHKLSEEQKLTYFQSLLRDDAIEFWQSLKITNQTTLAQVLRYFKNEYAKEDLKEVAKYKFDQMRYDPSAETFNDFLNKFEKVAKQAFGDKSSDITDIIVPILDTFRVFPLVKKSKGSELKRVATASVSKKGSDKFICRIF